MRLDFWSTDQYSSYEVAKAAGGVYSCDAPAFDDEVDRWGFNGGVLCDAMDAVYTALRCAGVAGTVHAVLVDGDKIIHNGDDDD